MSRGRDDIQPRQMPTPRIKSLEGKTVFIVGSPRYTLTLSEELQADGATVIYSRDEIKEHGLTMYLAAQAQSEMQRPDKMPDAVLIYKPRMDMSEGKFEDNPAMQLAAFAHSQNIPTLIMDSHRAFNSQEKLAMQQRNITYRDVLDIRNPISPVIHDITSKKGRDGVGGIA